jgi:threonylcarbamoyladenosine tRNA methylthiotransferase MtaB
MNRKYTTEEFKKATEMLRNSFEDVNLTTDIIVGFPGETEEEFNKTYEFLKNIAFYKMHIFKYSKRNGTVAAKMPNQVDGNIAEERSNKLIELSNNNMKMYNEKYVGKELEVLFEEKQGKYWLGHTRNYMVVKVESEGNLENVVIRIKIEKANSEELIGVI